MSTVEQITGQHPAPRGLSSAGTHKGRLPLLLLIYIALITVPFGFSAGPVEMTGTRMLLLVMVVPLTLRLFAGKYGRILPTDILFFMHIAWAMLAISVVNPDRAIQHIGAQGIEFIGSYVLGRAFIRDRDDMIALLRVLVVVVACTLPFALFETLTGRPILLELLHKVPGLGASWKAASEQRMGLERVQLAFSTPIHYGLYCSMVFTMCFVGLRGILGRVWRYAGSAAIGLGVFFSLSSGALLAMVLQLFLIAWAYVFRNMKQRWLLLAGLIAVAYVAIDLASNRTPIRVFMSYATFNPSTAYWRAAIFEFGMDNVWGSPIVGIGLNDWVRPAWMHSNSIDNYWLVVALRYGIPGFLTVAAGYAVALIQIGLKPLAADPLTSQIRLAWMITFSGLVLTLATVHIWTELYSFVFFMLGAGMWMLVAPPRDDAGDPAAEAAPLRAGWSRGPLPPPPRAAGAAPRYSRFPAGAPVARQAPPAGRTSPAVRKAPPLRRSPPPPAPRTKR